MIRGLAPRPGAEQSRWRLAGVFGVAAYMGYFGAAAGVLMLAVLAAMISESLIKINAIKNAISGAARSRQNRSQPSGAIGRRPRRASPRALGRTARR